MTLYQLKANGPFALNKEARMVYLSRQVFLDKADAEAFVEVFRKEVTTPFADGDVGYLDDAETKIVVLPLTLAGAIETEDMGTIAVEVNLPAEEVVVAEQVEVPVTPSTSRTKKK